jgi:tetratricopeptide (TPR) repeat protein
MGRDRLVMETLGYLSRRERHLDVYHMASRELLQAGAPGTVATIRYHLSRACCELCRPNEALAHARAARQHFDAAGDAVAALECQVEEATALCLKEDPGAAGLADLALRRCLALEATMPQDALCWILTRLGHIAIAHHDWWQGVRLLQAAADTEPGVRDSARLAHILGDLSAAMLALDQLDGALTYGSRTLDTCWARGDFFLGAQAENNVGLAMLRAGRPGDAAHHLGRSLATCEQLGLWFRRGGMLLSLVEYHSAQGQEDRAWDLASEAEAAAGRLGQRLTRAGALQWQGRIAAQSGRQDRVDRCFQEALALLAGPGAINHRTACHVEYGQLLEVRGDCQLSMLHYRWAAQLGRQRPTRPLVPIRDVEDAAGAVAEPEPPVLPLARRPRHQPRPVPRCGSRRRQPRR